MEIVYWVQGIRELYNKRTIWYGDAFPRMSILCLSGGTFSCGSSQFQNSSREVTS